MNDIVKEKMCLSREEAAQHIQLISQRIESHYLQGGVNEVECLVLLSGGIHFASDVVRSIDNDKVQMNLRYVKSVHISTTGKGDGTDFTSGSDDIDLIFLENYDFENKHVLIFDDVIDSGYTINHIIKCDKLSKASSIKVSALLNKKAARKVEVPLDFIGHDIDEDRWISGWGCDFNERWRNDQDVYYLKVL